MKYRNSTIDFKSIKEMPLEDRPREKMARLGAKGVGDLELLCIVLGSGTSARPVQNLAQDILTIVDRKGETGVTVQDLREVEGLGPAKASMICASLEFGRRLSFKRWKLCNQPQAVFENVRHYGDRMQEYFICLMLNGAHELMGVNVVTVGLVNRTLVHPREVFSDPIRNRATSIILAHNHPSGNLEPSGDDMEVTHRLRRAGALLGIEVLDHVIFSSDDYHSMVEHGEFLK